MYRHLLFSLYYSHRFFVFSFLVGTLMWLSFSAFRKKITNVYILCAVEIAIEIVCFALAVHIIHWRMGSKLWYIMTMVFAIGEYELWNDLKKGGGYIVLILGIFFGSMWAELIRYKVFHMDPHFKTCHGIMMFFIVYAVAGLVRCISERIRK